jgi:Dimerisation domain
MELDPSHIMQVGVGFWASKTVLSAVELELFTRLGSESMTGEQIGERLGLHPRAIYDFLDTLVALRFLERDGDGRNGRYRNTAETAAFLNKHSPTYIGGFLEMCNARLYRFWGDLTEALQTGKPQNEIKHTGKPIFDELYSDPARLEQFMRAMQGISLGGFHALAEKFDFSQYQTLCDSAAPVACSARSWPAATRACSARASTSRSWRRSPRRPSPRRDWPTA